MRKIKITSSLRQTVTKFNIDLFVNTRSDSFQLPITRLSNLKKKWSGKHKKYIDKIITNYDDILNADPGEMRSLISAFDSILTYSELNKKKSKEKPSFHEEVVHAMRYEDLRNQEFPYYLVNSIIKTCVYCNAQSTLTFVPVYYNKKKKKGRKKVISKLQLDHFHPKSKYPFLSTSFFNLYPTCANCNLAKGKEKALFELYTLDDDLDMFNFKIDDESIINYTLSPDINKLKIDFEQKKPETNLLENHNDLFQIQKIYDMHKDVGEELIWKYMANPQSYKDSLTNTFNKIFPDTAVIDRMLIGNYSKPEETFKRPLAKYTQDIARQLKLIK